MISGLPRHAGASPPIRPPSNTSWKYLKEIAREAMLLNVLAARKSPDCESFDNVFQTSTDTVYYIFRSFLALHGIDPAGTYHGDSDLQLERINVYFNEDCCQYTTQ